MRHIIERKRGLVVLRETTSPEYIDYIQNGSIAAAGLRLVTKLTLSQTEPQAWQSLEKVYDGAIERGWQPADGSYYAILQTA